MKSRDVNRAILEQAMINEENNVSSIIVPIPLNIVVSDSYSRTISANNGYKLIKEKSVVHNYAIVSIHVINKMPFLNKYENAIIAYIASVIKFNSNIVYIKPESICAILHTDKVYTRDFYPAIRHLTNLNIIYKTEYQSYYAVNPLAVFKGSLVEFVENYNTYIQSYNSVAIDDKIMLNRFAIEYKTGNNKIFKVYENKNSALKSIKVDKAKLRAVDEPIEVNEVRETDNKELPKFNGKKISFKF
jgi:hypothetical protein